LHVIVKISLRENESGILLLIQNGKSAFFVSLQSNSKQIFPKTADLNQPSKQASSFYTWFKCKKRSNIDLVWVVVGRVAKLDVEAV